MAGCDSESKDVESQLEAQAEGAEKSDSREWVESGLRAVDQLLQEVSSDWNALRESFLTSMDQFKQLLDMREKTFMATITSIRDAKMAALTGYKELLEAMKDRDSTSGEDEGAEQVRPPLPTFPGGISCGFVPDFTTLTLATTSLITAHAEEVRVGGSVRVTVVGGMNPEGMFWVRLLPGELRIEDVILQNISNTLQVQLEQSFVPLSSPRPGVCCAARYSQDQRWYRGRVVSVSKSNMVSVFFMDYGNTEDLPLSSLAPLPDAYLTFPPQMVRCSFTADRSPFSREAKWKFADLTHSQNLTAHLLQMMPAPVEEGGRRYVVRLVDESPGQPFDIGATVMALASVASSGRGSIRCRDVRYKNQPLPPNARQTISAKGTQSQSTPSQPPTQSKDNAPDKELQPPIQSEVTQSDTPTQLDTPTQSDAPSQSQSKTADKPQQGTSEETSPGTPSQPPTQSLAKSLDTSSQPPTQLEDKVEVMSSQPPTQSQEKASVNLLSEPPDTPSQPPTQLKEEPQVAPSQLPPQTEGGPPDTPSQPPTQTEGGPPDTPSQVEPSVCGENVGVSESASSVDAPSSEVAGDHAPSEDLVAQTTEHTSEGTSVEGAGHLLESAVKESAMDGGVPTESSKVISEEVAKRVTGDGTKPLALIRPLVIESECSDSDHQIPVLNGDLKNSLSSLHPLVKQGAQLTVYVATDLSKEGAFWAHMDATDAHEDMFEQLQQKTSKRKEEYTPVFFSAGDLCSAQFSEDGSWYRGRIEELDNQEFLVRYLDFGNQETRPLPLLAPLSGEFMTLPALAFKCSLATPEHQAFTQLEVDKFAEIIGEEPVTANVLEIDSDIVRVELSVKVGNKTISVNDYIYSADLSKEIVSMSFSLSPTINKSAPPLTIVDTHSMAASWADQMDELASPVGDGLTLMGADGQRFKSPSPSPQGQGSNEPSRPEDRQEAIEPAKPIEIVRRPEAQKSPKSSPSSRLMATPPSTRESSRSASPHSVKSHSSASSRDGGVRPRPSPRLDMAFVQSNIHRTLRGGRGTPIISGRGTPLGGTREKRMTGPPSVGRRSPSPLVTPSQSASSVKSTSPPPTNRSPSPWGGQGAGPTDDHVQLFVKNIPSTKNKQFLKNLFSQHGEVHGIQKDKDRSNVYYVTMSAQSAENTIKALHGKPLDRHSNPLVIQISRRNPKR